MSKKTKSIKQTETEVKLSHSPQVNAKTDEETKRLNKIWTLYCARVAAYNPVGEMRSLKKYLKDEYCVAVEALKVFEDELSKGVIENGLSNT